MYDCRSIARGIALAALVLAGQPGWSADSCDVPTDTWQPRSAVHELAQRHGWQIDKLKVDDGCYEIKGRDAEGRRFKAKIDPATLEIVRIKRERKEGERDRDREGRRSPASSQAPADAAAMSEATAPAARRPG